MGLVHCVHPNCAICNKIFCPQVTNLRSLHMVRYRTVMDHAMGPLLFIPENKVSRIIVSFSTHVHSLTNPYSFLALTGIYPLPRLSITSRSFISPLPRPFHFTKTKPIDLIESIELLGHKDIDHMREKGFFRSLHCREVIFDW